MSLKFDPFVRNRRHNACLLASDLESKRILEHGTAEERKQVCVKLQSMLQTISDLGFGSARIDDEKNIS